VGIALGPDWGFGRCFGQDVEWCRLQFLLGYAGARAFVAGRGTDPPGPAGGYAALIRAVRRIRARMPAK